MLCNKELSVGTLKERKNPRFLKRFPVTIKLGTKRVVGFTMDLSSGGMAISAKKSLEAKQIVTVDIKAGKFPIQLMGEVRWTKRAQRADTSKVGYEMGIELQSRSEEYIGLLEKVIREIDHEEREGTYQEDLHISYETRWQFVMEYEKNLKNNEIFIPTIKPFKVMQKVEFTMHLLEIMRVLHVAGTIMYVVDENDSKNRGKPPGIGLTIDKYRFGDETLMKQFVKDSGGHL